VIVRHQLASIHELARIEMLAGLPGETLGKLAERMEREELRPGDLVFAGEDGRGRFFVVISGMLRGGGTVLRPGDSFGILTLFGKPVQAMTPAVVASCDRDTFEELIRPAITPG
jgi:CRP-like cAMP-binding protein